MTSDFIGFVLIKVGTKSGVDDFTSVLSTDDDVIVTTIDIVGTVDVLHVSSLAYGVEETANASIPRAYARGFLRAVKNTYSENSNYYYQKNTCLCSEVFKNHLA